jgi:hypothetical protein
MISDLGMENLKEPGGEISTASRLEGTRLRRNRIEIG